MKQFGARPGRGRLRAAAVLAVAGATSAGGALPAAFDLRNVGGTNYSTSVKSQSGGTCWTHGAMAAMEGNLKRTGLWWALGHTNDPNLAEYHLDWWNGFNQHNNDDASPPAGDGLTVHQGGDYRVAAAYVSRGEGAVYYPYVADSAWYGVTPPRQSNTFEIYYARDIEWHTIGPALENIGAIKSNLMAHGAMGTCMYYGGGFYSGGNHYQPPSDGNDPNHAIAIVGWDDAHAVPAAPAAGAWLCKNSWGSGWNGDGHFWISYYDKHAARHPEMGAVAFKQVVLNPYQNIYGHDYHGWRDRMAVSNVFAAFAARTAEVLSAVSFYTFTGEVEYVATVYAGFEGGVLAGPLGGATGRLEYAGFHTVDLAAGVPLTNGQAFCVEVSLSAGGHAFDRTSTVDVLLDPPRALTPDDCEFWGIPADMGKGIPARELAALVTSTAGGGESYYFDGAAWVDLTNENATANFCVKALTLRDTDGDGAADAADEDDDNDGLSDAEEAVAGTDPLDRASVFAAGESRYENSDESCILTWGSVTARSYSVYYSTNLLGAEWLLLEGGLPATAPLNLYTAAPPAGAETLFYRLAVEP